MASPVGDSSSTMVVRVSSDDVVLYANGAMASYLRVTKAELTGAPLQTLAERAHGEVAACFQRPEGGRRNTSLVTDADGRVFEVKVQSEGGVMDIVFDEVTTAESICRDLRAVSGTSVDLLNEEELRTARMPERRFMTVSRARLNGVTHLAGQLEPMEVQLMVNSFVEEASDAVLETGCTAYPLTGDAVEGLFGAPRYFADHALRAIHAACSQLEKTAKLTAGFSRQGKEMPPMSCGIWTGEIFVGTLGNSKTRHYSAIGQPVDFAAELCRLARPGEVLVSEFTLQSLLQCLPDGWQAVRAESEADPDLGDFHWEGQGVSALGEDLARGIWLIGPGIETETSRVEFYLEYLWTLRVSEIEAPVPILRVVRPSGDGRGLELSEDNVVSSQFVQTLGKYKLVSVVGNGGMGKVWKALDRYGNIVAIKVLHASETTSEAQIKRFRREAEVMARLPHRNICRVLEMNEFEGVQYLVMEFVDGPTLAELLYDHLPVHLTVGRNVPTDLQFLIAAVRSEKSTRDADADGPQEAVSSRPRKSRILPVEQALNVFLKVCDAVQFAHEHGVLHRDLKPGNILLREDGEPLVADFGLAKIESGEAGLSLSVSGHVVGTLENMAPEQAESSKDVDERADLYSLGTILYQMLTGHRHFEATGNIVGDAQSLQNHEPPRLRGFNPKLDTDLEIIVLKCLRNSPVQRYRSVAALKADLQHYLRGEAISARPVSAVELVRKLVLRNRAISAVIAGSLLVLVAGSAGAFWKIAERVHAAEESAFEAERQRAFAQKSEKLAGERLVLAEQQKKQAVAAAAEAKKSEAEAKTARQLAEQAKETTVSARQETAEEHSARIAADKKFQIEKEKNSALEQQLDRKNADPLKNADQFIAELQGGGSPPPPELDSAAEKQAARGLSDASRTFRRQLSRSEIALYERNPEEVIHRLRDGINSVSSALLADPILAPAWLLKGRYHLACMELLPAAEAFHMAANAVGRDPSTGTPQLLEETAALLNVCDKLSQISQISNDRFAKRAALLAARDSPDDQNIAALLAFFKDKPVARKSNMSSSPIGREPTPAETALAILVRENGTGRIVFNDSGAGKDLTISGVRNLENLADLKGLAPTKIRVFGAETLDLQSLALLPLESLDLAGCPIIRLAPPSRNFPSLKVLSLRDTGLSDLAILRVMPALESLDLSGSQVTDISPLVFARRLQSLDAGKLTLQNLPRLRELRFLTRLTISPEKISDKAGLATLRQLPALRVLRAPGDPENQAPGLFWKKIDADKSPPENETPAEVNNIH